MSEWSCYIIYSLDTEKTYVGATNNPEKRLNTHNSGKGAKYTKGEKWVPLVVISGFENKNACLSFESGLKKISKKRANKNFDFLNNYYNCNLRYENNTKYNRVLDLLYFVHNFSFIGYKFMYNVNTTHPIIDPLPLHLNIFLEKYIEKLPWPYFVEV